MQFLHLTDLHYVTDQPFQKALIGALLKDVKQQVSKGFSPEFVVFSGDIVHNPDTPDIYDAFEVNFLKPLLAAVNLTEREVVFCPGNHVSHRAVKEWSEQREQLRVAMAGGSDQFTKLIKTGPFQSYIREINTGFFALAERCGCPWENPLAHTYSFTHQNVSFVALNTGFGCGPEGSAYDRGKLTIPAEEVLAAFQAVPVGHHVVSLMHHTPSDLSETATRQLIPIIENRSSLHFFGHVHNARPTTMKSPGGSCFMVQGGALYENSKIFNGYALIHTGPQPDRVAACYRTYYLDRNEFDVGTNVAPGGVFYSSDQARSYWENLTPVATNDDICMWLMETADAAIEENDKTITGRSLLETFVDPVITREGQAESSSSTPKRITTDQLLRSRTNAVIAYDLEYGATSLLSYLTMRFHQAAADLDLAVVPVLIDGRQICRAYSAVVELIIRRSLPESNDPRFKLRPLHDSGRIAILIDNIDPANTTHIALLTTLRKDYPKARLIVAVRMPFVDTQRLRPVVGIDDFEFLQLRTLTRGKVRSLVETWRLPPHYQVDAVVDEIYSKFRALGIPMTAVYVLIYLAILQDIRGYNPINSSNVIEQFIEVMLQKYKPAYAFRSSFDYRNQIDYLGAMAERMCRINSFTVEYEELYKWTKEYFDGIGLEHDFQKLISHFVDNRVFSVENNHIYFRYNIFLSKAYAANSGRINIS